jgi:HD-like signal output (HDOD) protein
MPNPICGPFDLRSLWQDSLRRGLFARALGKLFGLKDGEELFAASLLQDMAVPFLAKEQSQRYLKLLEARTHGEARLSDLEQTEFGSTHAEAAGSMVRHWRLPEEFARLIECHTQLDLLLAENTKDIGKLSVALSALLPANNDSQWHEREKFIAGYEKLAQGRGRSIADLFAQIDAEFAEFAPVLKLSIPAKTLVEHLTAEELAKA